MLPRESKEIRQNDEQGKDTGFERMYNESRQKENQRLYQDIIEAKEEAGKVPPIFEEFMKMQQYARLNAIRDSRPKW